MIARGRRSCAAACCWISPPVLSLALPLCLRCSRGHRCPPALRPPEEEEELLIYLSIYAVHHPRIKTQVRNTAEHASKTVTGARDGVPRRWRRPIGLPIGERLEYRRVMGGLRKEAPSGVRPEREPMLPPHLRHLRKSLRLATDQRDRVFWALSLCQWQMVKRCGDFVRGMFRPTGCA